MLKRFILFSIILVGTSALCQDSSYLKIIDKYNDTLIITRTDIVKFDSIQGTIELTESMATLLNEVMIYEAQFYILDALNNWTVIYLDTARSSVLKKNSILINGGKLFYVGEFTLHVHGDIWWDRF